MQPSRPQRTRRRRILLWSTAVVALVAIGFGAFAWWYLRDDAPDAVSIAGAASQVAGSATGAAGDDGGDAGSAGATSAGSTGAGIAGIDGTWNVDTTVGEFSFEDSTGTFVGFRVQERLSGIGSTTAVGRTPTVTGRLVAAGKTITEVEVEADMTDIVTNDRRRDDRVQDALETSRHPTATFVLIEPIGLPDGALTGESVTLDATGDLTIHGVTRRVTIPLEAQLVRDTIVVVGSLDVAFADYGVRVPTAPIVVSAEDHGPIELQLFFKRSA